MIAINDELQLAAGLSHFYKLFYHTTNVTVLCVKHSVLIDHFTVVCLVSWPLNENEAGGDLVWIEISLLFLCKFVLISMRTTSLT